MKSIFLFLDIMTRKTQKNVTGRQLVVNASKAPENYITYHINAFDIGVSSAATPPSIGFNDYILNSGAHLGLGTGTNLRVGKHVFFTYLRLKLKFNTLPGQWVRMLVVKATGNENLGNQITNAGVCGVFESDILEAPMSGSNPNVADRYLAPSSEYTIVADKTIGFDTPFSVVNVASGDVVQTTVDLTIPLMLQRMYNSSNTVDKGDWSIYFVSNARTPYGVAPASAAKVCGQMRLEFINQWDWEAIPRAIKSTISSADDVLAHAGSSTAVRALLNLLKLV